MKICTLCNKNKELTEFNKKQGKCRSCQSSYGKQWRSTRKEELKLKVQAYRKAYPDKWRNRHLVSQYGITLSHYNSMLNKQHGVCAICKKSEFDRSKRYKNLSLDHCHKTGKIRGLLCNKCNRSLGLLEENVSNILALADYIVSNAVSQAPAA